MFVAIIFFFLAVYVHSSHHLKTGLNNMIIMFFNRFVSHHSESK